MLIQFRISDKDDTLNDLIKQLEHEGKGKRGYVGNKLRDMIKAYHLLSEHTGETDPYKLMMKLASNNSSAKNEQVEEEVEEEQEKVAVDVDHWMSQFSAFGDR
jgi:hypothetical protein